MKKSVLNIKNSDFLNQLGTRRPIKENKYTTEQLINCHICKSVYNTYNMVTCCVSSCKESFCVFCLKKTFNKFNKNQFYILKEHELMNKWKCPICKKRCPCVACPQSDQLTNRKRSRRKNKVLKRENKLESDEKLIKGIKGEVKVDQFDIYECEDPSYVSESSIDDEDKKNDIEDLTMANILSEDEKSIHKENNSSFIIEKVSKKQKTENLDIPIHPSLFNNLKNYKNPCTLTAGKIFKIKKVDKNTFKTTPNDTESSVDSKMFLTKPCLLCNKAHFAKMELFKFKTQEELVLSYKYFLKQDSGLTTDSQENRQNNLSILERFTELSNTQGVKEPFRRPKRVCVDCFEKHAEEANGAYVIIDIIKEEDEQADLDQTKKEEIISDIKKFIYLNGYNVEKSFPILSKSIDIPGNSFNIFNSIFDRKKMNDTSKMLTNCNTQRNSNNDRKNPDLERYVNKTVSDPFSNKNLLIENLGAQLEKTKNLKLFEEIMIKYMFGTAEDYIMKQSGVFREINNCVFETLKIMENNETEKEQERVKVMMDNSVLEENFQNHKIKEELLTFLEINKTICSCLDTFQSSISKLKFFLPLFSPNESLASEPLTFPMIQFPSL